MPQAKLKSGEIHSPRVFPVRFRGLLMQVIEQSPQFVHLESAISHFAAKRKQTRALYLITCIRHFPDHWPEFGGLIDKFDFDTKGPKAEVWTGSGQLSGVQSPDYEVLVRARPRLDAGELASRVISQIPRQN